MKAPRMVVCAVALSPFFVAVAVGAPPAPPSLPLWLADSPIPIDPALELPQPPVTPPSSPVEVPAPPVQVPDSILSGVWQSLPVPDDAEWPAIAALFPGAPRETVRIFGRKELEAALGRAAARGWNPLDVFTDPLFRVGDRFYIPQADLAAAFDRYDIHLMTPFHGVDESGKPFQTQGLMIGAGRIEIPYERGPITFRNPKLENDRFTVAARVVHEILGPGDISVKGISTYAFIFNPDILRITKIGPTKAHIHTSRGDRDKPVSPIHLSKTAAATE